MDVLFENGYIRNKEVAKEVYRYYCFQRKRIIVLYVIIVAILVSDILNFVFSGIFEWLPLLYVLLILLWQFFLYHYQVKMVIKRDCEGHGKEMSVETVVTSEHIQSLSSNGAVNKVEFHNIRSAVQTKNLIILRTKANLLYILRKDSFTNGTKDEFIAFLETKGVKVK